MGKIKESYRTYAGVGETNAPADVLKEMKALAEEMLELGFILRTGGDEGSHDAFMSAIEYEDDIELFLPWEGYGDLESQHVKPSLGAFEQAFLHHPNWGECDQEDRRIHARSSHIVLGADLKSPVELVICYTKDGKSTGDTGQLIRIADSNFIQVFDYGLGIEYTNTQLQLWMDKNL